jgi:hypothetical protein
MKPNGCSMWLALVGIGMASGLVLAQAPALSGGPPLLPGEIFFRTANDCLVVLDEIDIKPPATPESTRADVAKMLWTGVCKDGLAEGKGLLGTAENIALLKRDSWQEASRGRFTGRASISFGGMPDISYTVGNTGVRLPLTDMPYRPVWSNAPDDMRKAVYTTLGAPDGLMYVALSFQCWIDRARFKNCSGEGYFVYGVRVWRIRHPDGHDVTEPEREGQTFWCPNPKTPVGCEVLWNEKTAEAVSQINAFLDRFNIDALAKERRLTELNATWPAEYAALEERRRADAQREIARVQAQRDAEARRLAAERDREAKAFQAKLSTSNAGQLFSLADELAAKGEADKARQTLRSLISRFPDHPLAATAAQQMAGVAPSAPSRAPVSAQGGSAKFSSVCIRDLEKIEDLQQAADMVSIPASNDLFLIDINDWVANLMQRCASYDPKAESIVARSRPEAARIRQYCAQPHQDYECTQWGVGANSQGTAETLNERYHQFFEGEYRKAMADPNYSADKGTAAGPGMKTETAARSANAGSTGCASTPQESFRKFNDELEQFSQAKPNAPPTSTSGSGARAQYQYALFFGTEGLTILEKYRVCLSPADYQANKTALEGMRDNGRAGCERLSTSPGSCTATYPAGWPAN